jgi:hypothetical protein
MPKQTLSLWILILIGLLLGILGCGNDVDEAKMFCAELIEHLEQKKKESGAYPPNIDYYLKHKDRLPSLLQKRRLQYVRHENGFTLTFVKTGGLFPRFHEYDSQKKEWTIND